MVKGCERRVVVYKSKNSKYFCEVHFIMKEQQQGKDGDKRDIIAEANRIIEESTELGKDKRKRQKRREIIIRLLFLLLGFVFSSVAFYVSEKFGIQIF